MRCAAPQSVKAHASRSRPVRSPAWTLSPPSACSASISSNIPAARRRRPGGGTPAEQQVDLDAVDVPTLFYEGNAREAALAFPRNTNVVAAAALAGVGFERTRVRLIVDPTESRNCHIVRARGAFGELETRAVVHTLPTNAKTSALAPWSLVRSRIDVIVV